MKKYILLLLLLPLLTQAQIISYEKIGELTFEAIDSILVDRGVPSGVVIPEYEVDAYKVLYLTPFKHKDSLVQASGAIMVPRTGGCAVPLSCYHHGTQSKRSKVPSTLNGGQFEIGILFASIGYVVAMPDYLGLGDSPEVPVHPYIHAFSQSHTGLNLSRAAVKLQDSLDYQLNEQLFIFGYSQGGFATSAMQKLIEEQYPEEFNIAGSVPMSGPYDLEVAQVDLIASDEEYPTPGYLPFIFLSYQQMYGNLYDDISDILKAPYDSIIPPMFFSGKNGLGPINRECTPVPKHMVKDSVVAAFESDLNHPLRLNLADNHLLDWAPRSPTLLLYCNGDDQVSYLNSENAYDSWTANGSSDVEKLDLGGFDHNGCAMFAFLTCRNYFDQRKLNCDGTSIYDLSSEQWQLFPNPASDQVRFAISNPSFKIEFYDLKGKKMLERSLNDQLSVKTLPSGLYVYRISQKDLVVKQGKFVKR